jgi:hypothetical protein
MAAREFLMAVQESAFLTPVTTPTVWTTSTTYGLANAQAYYCRLDGGNAFTMRPRPVIVKTPYGGGKAITAYAVSDKIECKGKLTMKLSVSQAPFWLSWAGVNINSGQTTPWVTTEPAGDLTSVSLYHAITMDSGTVKRRVYLGCKVTDWQLTVSEQSTVCTLSLGIIGSTPQGNQFDSSSDPNSTVFPAAADNNYPVDPYLFIHSAGHVTIGGQARTKYTDLSINCTNAIDYKWYSSRFVQAIRWFGRDTTAAMKVLYSTSPDDRTTYEGLTSETASIELTNGTHSVTMNLNAQNIYNPFEEDLPLDKIYMFNQTSANMWDASAGSDFTLAFA